MEISLPDGRRYPIIIEAGALNSLQDYLSGRAIVITDENVAPHWLEKVKATSSNITDKIILPAGEATKSFNQLEKLLDQLLSLSPDRQTTLIALGGGVVGDITGFAASILLRGVPFIQIPTTLLSQVDSSVGGKTGINSSHGKNLIGSFYQPQAVLIDIDTLSTLPKREMRGGFAEVIKAACIADAAFFNSLEENHAAVLNQQPDALKHAIQTSVAIKARIVEQDEKEGGIRALLNLGHTFGHALEKEFAYDGRLSHGEAVAIGMMMAFEYRQLDEATRLRTLIENSGLPVQPPYWPDSAKILAAMKQDKKASQGKLTFVLPTAIGQCELVKDVSEASMIDFLSKTVQN